LTRIVVERIRCEDCGNADPARFRRTYVEESRERLVDGDWAVESAWEYADGSETYTQCEVCESAAVDERYADAEAPSSQDAVERLPKLREERDAYREALEELGELCKQVEASGAKRRFSHAISSEIPALVDDVLTLHAVPNPSPPPDLEELPF